MPLETFITSHQAMILFVLGTVGSALVVTMPPPGTPFVLYEWIYDFSHQFINSKNTRG